MKKIQKLIIVFILTLAVMFGNSVFSYTLRDSIAAAGDFVKWVDFNASSEIMNKVYSLDKKTRNDEVYYDFVSTLAYLALKNGNKFNLKTDTANLKKLTDSGKHPNEIYGENKYFKYYVDCYNAVFSGYFGEYTNAEGNTEYGLKTYYPLAYGYGCMDGNDFGNSRSYGFKRRHLGHDMFGAIGTPIIAVEGGTVTELGWNRYGGWRVGIRSFDGQRFYYYAHLRKNKPYAENFKKNDTITAGQVIGYMGVTGYSTTENKNMDAPAHLHFGLQLIFDKSQEDGNGEIWIDVYQLTKFLAKNRARVRKNENGHYESYNLKTSPVH